MTVRTGVVEVVDVVEDSPRPEPDGGLGALRTERGNLPLELIDVRSSVAGLAVRTELAQGFRNPYDVPLEATYVFPLPDRAAVTRLRMEAADRVIEGVVKEREEARADYDAAIADGHRASIAEEERPGVFTLRVGNIMPGERVTIRTTLSGRLPYEDGQATFRFPLVVAPRYIPGGALPGEQVGSGTASDTDQVPDASRISPPILLPGFPNPVRLSIEVAVDPAGLPLTGLTSSLHGVSVAAEGGDGRADRAEDAEGSGSRYVVRLDPGARADRDFVLRLAYGGSAAATSLAIARDAGSDSGSDTGTFLLTVLPPDPTGTTRPRDVVLVLDRSGSMGGWKMTAARRAAARIVDTLTAADRFAVLTFDDRVDVPDGLPADALSIATDRHRFRAVQHLASVEARGGTEMVEPLRRAAALLTDDDTDHDKVLILVTDGQVGNEDSLLATLGPKLTRLRVHTVGIDTAVNEGFLRRLASLGGGHCELVESEGRLDEAMDAIHRRIGTPLVTGLRLSGVDGLEPDPGSVTPTRLPDLFAGAPLVVAGRYRTSTSTSTSTSTNTDSHSDADSNVFGGLVITGEAPDGTPWTHQVAAVETADASLAQFWARGRIRDLEDRYVSTYEGQAEIERAIVATSVGHSVLSRFTAFVAVDTRVVNAGGAVKQVTQPVDLPHGWEGYTFTGAMQMDTLSTRTVRAKRSAAPAYGAPPPAPASPSGARGFGTAMPQVSAPGSAPMPQMPPAPTGQPAQQPMPKEAGPGSAPMPQVAPLSSAPMPQVATPDSAPMPERVPAPSIQPPQQPTQPTLDTLAAAWLPRLKAAANDTAEAQEKLLAEFTAALASHLPAELLKDLTTSDQPPAERLQSAITFLESLKKPRRPFWKR